MGYKHILNDLVEKIMTEKSVDKNLDISYHSVNIEKVKELANGKGSILDRILGKVVSRKLLVFATATVLLAQYGLDPDTWGMIAIVYIGGQSVIDAAKTWRHG